MNKNEFVARIAADADLKKSDAEKFLEAFVSNVKEIMARDPQFDFEEYFLQNERQA